MDDLPKADKRSTSVQTASKYADFVVYSGYRFSSHCLARSCLQMEQQLCCARPVSRQRWVKRTRTKPGEEGSSAPQRSTTYWYDVVVPAIDPKQRDGKHVRGGWGSVGAHMSCGEMGWDAWVGWDTWGDGSGLSGMIHAGWGTVTPTNTSASGRTDIT